MLARLLLASTALVAAVSTSTAQNRVDGYQRRDGTYVQPHYRTNPNDTLRDNYSTQGNTNPYTGRAGTVNPNPNYDSNRLYQPGAPTQQRRY